MNALNPGDVIWLSGTADEINLFLKSEQVRDRAVFLGHPDDAKRMLQKHIQPGVLGIALSRLVEQRDLEIAFILLEGKIVGLIREEKKT